MCARSEKTRLRKESRPTSVSSTREGLAIIELAEGREASVDEHQERALQLKQRFLSQRPQR